MPQGAGGLLGTPQLLTRLQALQDLPWHGGALGPGSAVRVPNPASPPLEGGVAAAAGGVLLLPVTGAGWAEAGSVGARDSPEYPSPIPCL